MVEIKNFPVASEDLLITMRGVPLTSINIFNDPPLAIHIDGVYPPYFIDTFTP